ncbi:MAG TPA: hypothetical protein VNX86_04555 [Rhizomicrobium sp.]|jgi:hypothetical protein|nr:hypothetical protein [Rhizomicrobium sp.]
MNKASAILARERDQLAHCIAQNSAAIVRWPQFSARLAALNIDMTRVLVAIDEELRDLEQAA